MSDFFGDLLSLGKKIIDASEKLQAEIDKQSPASSDSVSSESAADASAVSSKTTPTYSSLYQRHVENGCHDPLKLLTVDDAERLMECVIATPSTTGEEEYIGCHYGCADDRSMYVSLSVSALMPWDYITDEVTSQPAPRIVGDEALALGDMLYVRQGDSFFWIYGRGVDDETIYRVAEHVADRMAS